MAHDSIFRIFSMTKPIVSVGIMMLVEDGHFMLNDPVAKFIPEFADQKVGVENNGKLDLVPVKRQMTVQDLLRHTSGLTYDHTGNGLVQQLYQQSRLRSRKITNAEHADHDRRHAADLPARRGMELQPLDRRSRPHHRGRLRQIARRVPDRTHPGAAADGRDRVPHRPEANAGRLAEPFPTDPWNGDKVQLFNMLEKPVMESGGGGLVSTTMDYARFCQMLLNGGTLDGNRIIGRKTLELMASDHLVREREGRIRR